MKANFRRRVAVIGAGVSGLAAARHFGAPGSPFECQVFEQNSEIGGTWDFTPYVTTDKIGRPIHSSVYANLRTNLPKEVMSYPDFPFPDQEKSFLDSNQVLEYLKSYADHFELRHHIRFNNWVKDVRPFGESVEEEKWQLTIFDWINKETRTEIYDALMICKGHFFQPNMPEFKCSDIFEGNIIHSRDFRLTAPYTNKRVLIVGGFASALDITMELAKVSKQVTMSHHLKEMATNFPENVKMAPDVDYFDKSGVTFVNGQRDEFDDVIYCTGYKHSYPFLHESCGITTNGYGVEPLHKHLINIEHPSMCFLAINNYILSNQLADLQAKFFFKLLIGAFELPSKEEMYRQLRKDQKFRQEELGLKARLAHKLGVLQKEYYDEIADAAGVKRIPSVITKLEAYSCKALSRDFYTFRDKRYKLIDDESFVEL
ncbi:senecionine N-oxygenase-like [Neocloeon triangulifer]|uniref:senecionine N-oxygenase-like n=1 Tax=Neocloeon triangulifer TaxID=2078957 RepID=UPI00286F1F16|nr:senecionine N-oxygenase-like [Neocloeon triangulifer]